MTGGPAFPPEPRALLGYLLLLSAAAAVAALVILKALS